MSGGPFHVMAKPIGPICNLDCRYCFYLEKEQDLFPGNRTWAMDDVTLEAFISQYISAQPTPEVSFAWQGGEPTLLGVDYFRKVVQLQRKHGGGRAITNAIQTNGTLLDDAWGAFLAEQRFLVGVSIDGPRRFHDAYRVDKKGRPTFDAVHAAMRLLKRHGVEFNTLCVVSSANAHAPLEVYHFLRTEGSGFMQFIPLVERVGSSARGLGPPPLLRIVGQDTQAVTPWSVGPRAYGEFLVAIFDRWVRHDIGRTFVQIFDVQLAIAAGLPSPLCVFAPTCGDAVAIEHQGDVYACDHYVYPQHRLGNIHDGNLGDMVASAGQRKFGTDKRDTLPDYCRKCAVRSGCNGECPKHRFAITPDGEPGLNYLCPSYKRLLHHIGPYMDAMVRLVRAGRAPAELMSMIAGGWSPARRGGQ